MGSQLKWRELQVERQPGAPEEFTVTKSETFTRRGDNAARLYKQAEQLVEQTLKESAAKRPKQSR